MAVAEASFSTVMVSISLGLSQAMALEAINRSSCKSPAKVPFPSGIGSGSRWMIPSTTHRGSWLPRSVEVPRIRILGLAPTWPVWVITDMPGTTPCNIWSMLVSPATLISSAFIENTEPV